ncbi:hypothetical protein [Hymenobacter sp. CRA2]|nr:hypothetical protein [Hymenobacter sp. CRA2]
METQQKKYRGFGGLRGGVPWWFYIMLLVAFYLFGWVLRFFHVIPSH